LSNTITKIEFVQLAPKLAGGFLIFYREMAEMVEKREANLQHGW
jgi:hypothetical protein